MTGLIAAEHMQQWVAEAEMHVPVDLAVDVVIDVSCLRNGEDFM